ncbi:hypothetical protein [Intrasporangium flavum]|uniref:hypothetical protein n=1 Tax=Intrasporangium flavum TaxID=1428657 RepID=UPI001A97BCED|nr:hypothetical protein [Intrasporangium flavum]
MWLLTEVPRHAELTGSVVAFTGADMAPERAWAAVAVRAGLGNVDRHADPHPASVHVSVDDLHVCSSVLPWRSAGAAWPGDGHDVGSRTEAAVGQLLRALPAGRTVWGGDWNHALEGPETAGSAAGRTAIRTALEQLDLRAVTADVPHRFDGLKGIDHIAVPTSAPPAEPARRVEMATDGRHLSDHDAYVTDIDWS